MFSVTGDAGDEAEYAWLPVDCMKPFKSGDETGNADGSVSGDVTLQLSVAAADKALANSEKLARLRAEALGADPKALLYHTDSDGGTTCSANLLLVLPSAHYRTMLFCGLSGRKLRSRAKSAGGKSYAAFRKSGRCGTIRLARRDIQSLQDFLL